MTDEDVVELRACIDLGFGFDSPDRGRGLSDTLPALELYYAVNRKYCDTVSKSSSSSLGSLTTAEECDSPPCSVGCPLTIFGPGNFLRSFGSNFLCFQISIRNVVVEKIIM